MGMYEYCHPEGVIMKDDDNEMSEKRAVKWKTLKLHVNQMSITLKRWTDVMNEKH